MAVWMVQGNEASGHLDELTAHATSGTSVLWTIPKHAARGDLAAFYLVRPTAAIVATGVVESDTEDGAPHGWPTHYMAHLGDINILPAAVSLERLRTLFPTWGYLKTPRRETHVPVEHESRLLRALDYPGAAALTTEWSVRENLITESRVLSRSRNRRLRQEAVQRSGGICQACDLDLSSVMPDGWDAVIQVHHKRPLHTLQQVTATTLADLLVLCPTCHVLAHVGRVDRPRGLPALRKLWN